MKIFSVLTIALVIIFQTVGFAATGTFSASGEYTMSDYDTPEIAELHALEKAMPSKPEFIRKVIRAPLSLNLPTTRLKP